MFPDYPKLGVWPDAYYIDLQHVRRAVATLRRAQGLRVRPGEDARRPAGDAAVLHHLVADELRPVLPSDLDGSTPPPPVRRTISVEPRLEQRSTLWKFHVDWTTPANSTLHRPDDASPSPPSRPPAAAATRASRSRARPEARLARRPPDVPARLPQLRRPRVAGRRPTASPPAARSACAGTSCGSGRRPDGLPAGHLRARTRAYRWMGSVAMDQQRRHRPRLQRLELEHAPEHPLHRAPRGRPARPR